VMETYKLMRCRRRYGSGDIVRLVLVLRNTLENASVGLTQRNVAVSATLHIS